MATDLRTANAYCREGKYAAARDLYRKICADYPPESPIRSLIEFNINQCERRLVTDTPSASLAPREHVGPPAARPTHSAANTTPSSKPANEASATPKPIVIADQAVAANPYKETFRVSGIKLPAATNRPVTILVDAHDQSEDNLQLILARVVFYLLVFPNVTVAVFSKHQLPARLAAPEWLEDGISEVYQNVLKSRLTQADAKAAAKIYEIYIRYAETAHPAVKKSARDAEKANGVRRKVYDCRLHERFEASRIIDAIREYADPHLETSELDAPHAIAPIRLAEYARATANYDFCNLILNGPTVGNFDKLSLVGGHSIVCNTVIANDEILAHANITLLCFADPIFHFGFNTYAATFRESICKSLDQLPHVKIAIPAKYYYLFVVLLPQFRDRVIPLDMKKRDRFNLKLLEDPTLRAVGNVLTLLMLPVACSVANDIRIFGADGRPLHEDEYFWGHDAKSQLEQQKMDDIQKAHPSFFDLEYNDYYLNHLKECGEIIQESRAEGKKVRLFTPSYIPAFNDVFEPNPPEINCRGVVYIWYDFEKSEFDKGMIAALTEALKDYQPTRVRFFAYDSSKDRIIRNIIRTMKTIHGIEDLTLECWTFSDVVKKGRFAILRLTDDKQKQARGALQIIAENKTISRIVSFSPFDGCYSAGFRRAVGILQFNKLHPESRRQIRRHSKLLQSHIGVDTTLVLIDRKEKLLEPADALIWKLMVAPITKVIRFAQFRQILSRNDVLIAQTMVLIDEGDLKLLEGATLIAEVVQYLEKNKSLSFVCSEDVYLILANVAPRLITKVLAISVLLEKIALRDATLKADTPSRNRLVRFSGTKLHDLTTREFVDACMGEGRRQSVKTICATHERQQQVLSLPLTLEFHSPPLRSDNPLEPVQTEQFTEAVWVNINPSAADTYGHYIHFDRVISENLPKSYTGLSLVHRDFPSDYAADAGILCRQTFTSKTTALRHPSHVDSDTAKVYAKELREALDEVAARPGLKHVHLFHYDGALSHLLIATRALDAIAKGYPDIHWHLRVNLMKSSDISYVQESPMFLHEFSILENLPANLSVTPYIDTEESRKFFYRYFSVPAFMPELKVLPFFTPTARPPAGGETIKGNDIFFHVNSTTEGGLLKKGLDIALDSIISLAPQLRQYRFVVRKYEGAKCSDSLKEKWRQAEEINNVFVVKGRHIADEEYRRIYTSAAIVVLPYRATAFSTRTSAGLLDAWLHGAFPIVLPGTWMAKQIEMVAGAYGAVANSAHHLAVNAAIKDVLEFLKCLCYPNAPVLPSAQLMRFSPRRFVDTVIDDGEG